MGDHRRLVLLVLVMAAVAIVVGATALGVVYDAALDRERQRLAGFADSEARLMAALAPAEVPGILEEQRLLGERAVGRTAELQVARREGDQIAFVSPARGSSDPAHRMAFDSELAEPMRRALSGLSGTMIGRDDEGRRVLAAYAPLPALGLGLVAKIDMWEIDARYLGAAAIAGTVALAVIAAAAFLFLRLGEPVIRRTRENESRYRALFENMNLGVAVCEAVEGGRDFVFTDLNRAGEQIARIRREDVIGKRVTEAFPGIGEFGALDLMRRVWQTGQAEYLAARPYRDDRLEGWRDTHAYRLPTGEVVSLFADISERIQALGALRESEARYRNLVEAQPDPICQFLPDTTLTFVNRAYAEFYGTERDRLIGRRWLDFAAPGERPRFLEELASFTPEDPARHEETRSTRADGSVRWYLCHLRGFFDEAGAILSFQTFGTDITARKHAEEQLARQLDLLTAITDSAADAIFVTDGADRVTLMNPAAERIFGWSRQDLAGRTLHEAIHAHYPDGRPCPVSTCPLGRVYTTGETVVGHEDVFFRKDGSPVEVACSNAPLVIGGRLAGSVLVAHDITERRRTEAALRESEARYRTAGETIRYGVWVCNARGGIEFVSRTFLDLIGKTLDEVRPRGWLDRLPAEDLKPTLEAWRACVASGCDWSWEHRVRGGDGVYRTILSLARPVRDEADRITSWVGFNLDISARKETERALRESEARFRGMFENAAVGMANVALDGTFLRVNDRLCEIVGYDRDALLGRTFQDITSPDDLPADLDRIRAMQRGEIATYTLEKRLIRNDGSVVWISQTVGAQRDDAGEILYFLPVVVDISARKRAEAALQQHARALEESEVRMRTLLDASQDEILLLSIDGVVLAINQAAERRLRRRTGGSNPVGTHLDRLLPADQVQLRMALVRQVAATATLAHWEVPIRGRWFEFWFYPALQPNRPVTEVAVFAREITEQRKVQADLGKLYQAMQQSPTSVVITDRAGTIEYVNPKFLEVTGYTLAEAIGQNPRILKSGQTSPAQYRELWTTITAGRVWRGELLNRKKSGELFWELASIAPVKNEDDEITNFVAVKEDITERREVEEQLRQSQKMQALGQLTGGIAHDFNNLLAIVIGNLQLLEERVNDDPKAREYLDDALWSAQRGGELTHRLLAFARKQPLRPAVIDLNDVVRGMTELLRRTLGTGIRIDEKLASDLWLAVADRGELERAIVNLAVNSRDAMRNTGMLMLETQNDLLDERYAEQYEEVVPGAYVRLAVTDTGSGMPAEVMQHVFEPFFTTKGVGKGSGLGLSMVYGFVKQSGGHISIYSRVGQGTCVKLYLPRAPTAPEHPHHAPPDALSEAVRDAVRGKVVLVVEDEAKLRRVAVKMLEQLGVRTFQAATARDALSVLADTPVDVLFTDCELPGGMSGADLAREAQHRYPRIRVLFTTGYARTEDLPEGGVQDEAPWLFKPYSQRDLATALGDLLITTTP